MRKIFFLISLLLVASNSYAEEQVMDSTGRVIEIRQQYGDTSYAYDGSRNFIYMAMPAGNGEVLDYRDKWGVQIGLRGPGLHWHGNTIPLPNQEK